jgi:HK97 family phage prohead protease
MKTLSYDFEIQRKGGHIVIEGMANAATVDRMKELIDPAGWSLDNYRKNPTVLFDHGKDPSFGSMPIGKAIACEMTDKGLYTKIQLSNSKTEKLTAIRDLVEEGILKTFSVGFNPITSEKSGDNPEVMIIKKAELIECSVVPIPMNQDSTFSVSGKSLKKICPYGQEWLQNWLHKQELLKASKYLAAAVIQRMDDLIAAKSFKSRMEIISAISNELQGSTAERIKSVHELMDGYAVEGSVVRAAAKVLGLQKEFLEQVGKHGSNVLSQVRDYKAENVKMEPAKKMTVHEIVVSKDTAGSLEAAKEMVEAAGYKSDKVTEDEASYKFEQNSPEGLDVAAGVMIDLGNGAMAHVAPPKVSESPADEAPKLDEPKIDEAKAAEMNTDEKPPEAPKVDEKPADEGASEEAKEAAWENFKAAVSQALEGEIDSMPDWMKQAFDAYQKAVGEVSKLLGNPETKNIDGTDDNPYHALARQTNVLLGTLINEVQKMSTKMDGMVDLSTKLAQVEPKIEEEEKPAEQNNEQAKSIDMLSRFRTDFQDIDMRLKRLNV